MDLDAADVGVGAPDLPEPDLQVGVLGCSPFGGGVSGSKVGQGLEGTLVGQVLVLVAVGSGQVDSADVRHLGVTLTEPRHVRNRHLHRSDFS